MFDWITGFVRPAGYVGVFLLMLAENVVPPIPPSMPLAGFAAARGHLSVLLVVLAVGGVAPPSAVLVRHRSPRGSEAKRLGIASAVGFAALLLSTNRGTIALFRGLSVV